MNSYDILKAMDGVEDETLHDAGKFLGYMEPRHSRGRGHKKLWRTVLLAAAIASLLGATAYAAGWFGLSSRVQPAPPPVSPGPQESESPREPGGYISANGYANSPAAQAHQEWSAFSFGYDPVFDDSWKPEDPELEKIASVYQVFDQTMLDKLLEIRDKYGVTLHTQEKLMPGSSMFYSVTGTGNFILSDDFDMKGAAHFVYEDGSFCIQARAVADGEACFVNLYRGIKNVLDPTALYVYDLALYREELYTAADGTEVNLAYRKDASGGEDRCLVFYDCEDYIVTVSADTGNAKAVADMFDYKTMCRGKTDLSVLDPGPRIAQKKEGLLTMEEFMETPEYQASSAFQAVYTDFAYEEANAKWPGVFGHFPGYYYGDFPTGKESLDQTLEELLTEYPLTMPTKAEAIHFDEHVPTEYIVGIGWYSTDLRELNLPKATQADYDSLLGTEHFITNEEAYFIAATRWDNGCWQAGIFAAHGSFNLAYLPKGCFYPLMTAPETAGSGYAYDSACGEQVYIYSYPTVLGTCSAYALYETDAAYVVIEALNGMPDLSYIQLASDSIDFTRFP